MWIRLHEHVTGCVMEPAGSAYSVRAPAADGEEHMLLVRGEGGTPQTPLSDVSAAPGTPLEKAVGEAQPPEGTPRLVQPDEDHRSAPAPSRDGGGAGSPAAASSAASEGSPAAAGGGAAARSPGRGGLLGEVMSLRERMRRSFNLTDLAISTQGADGGRGAAAPAWGRGSGHGGLGGGRRKRLLCMSEADFAGKYRLGGVVVESLHPGMSILYAERVADGFPVVVKARLKAASFKKRSEEREWRSTTVVQLNMPKTECLCELLEFISTETNYFVVMEKVKGRDLFEEQADHEVRHAEAREIIFQVLEALRAMHGAGRIHKDLKLENVMVDLGTPRAGGRSAPPAEGRSPGSPAVAKVIDFDTVENWEPTSPRAKDVLGTDGYIAPEAYFGQFSPASDVYCVGVIMYKLLTRRFPIRKELFDDQPGENYVGSKAMRRIYERLKETRTRALLLQRTGAPRLPSCARRCSPSRLGPGPPPRRRCGAPGSRCRAARCPREPGRADLREAALALRGSACACASLLHGARPVGGPGGPGGRPRPTFPERRPVCGPCGRVPARRRRPSAPPLVALQSLSLQAYVEGLPCGRNKKQKRRIRGPSCCGSAAAPPIVEEGLTVHPALDRAGSPSGGGGAVADSGSLYFAMSQIARGGIGPAPAAPSDRSAQAA
ncbi:unnamed protein product [Prorocentrum cordatum]|uniref:Protein kinase domain-containing protein n=1 Tax=Prorocentrum cordatum TaxID=2364126 RepID=A0ABN9TUV6_9DINO|nr:unnamed protein product [Polarella glacialis]